MKSDSFNKSIILGTYSLGSGIICQLTFMMFVIVAETPSVYISATIISYLGYFFLFLSILMFGNDLISAHSLLKENKNKFLNSLIILSLFLFFVFLLIGINADKHPGIYLK